jgi:hypothetical protein
VREVENETVLMNRVGKALQGWAKRAPAGARDPPAWEGVMAIVGWLVFQGRCFIALGVLVQTICYLRPGELVNLHVEELQGPPEERPGEPWYLLLHSEHSSKSSETGERDESIVIDAPGFSWIWEDLRLLQQRRRMHGQGKLWPFEAVDYLAPVKEAAAATGQPDVVPYSVRLSGASHGLVVRERTTAEVKARGRWKSDASLRRYGKPAKELQAKDNLPPAVLQYGRQIERLLPHIFNGEIAPPVPPALKQQPRPA